jgi:hypothetical protein
MINVPGKHSVKMGAWRVTMPAGHARRRLKSGDGTLWAKRRKPNANVIVA